MRKNDRKSISIAKALYKKLEYTEAVSKTLLIKSKIIKIKN